MWPQRIPTSELQLGDVPTQDSTLYEIELFALTFDPREENAPKVSVDDLDNVTMQSSLVELRAHLYTQQRRWNHFGRNPDSKTEQQLRAIVDLIRQQLTKSAMH